MTICESNFDDPMAATLDFKAVVSLPIEKPLRLHRQGRTQHPLNLTDHSAALGAAALFICWPD